MYISTDVFIISCLMLVKCKLARFVFISLDEFKEIDASARASSPVTQV